MMSSWCVFLFICVYIIKFLWGPDDEDDDYLCAKKHFCPSRWLKNISLSMKERSTKVTSLNFNIVTLFPFFFETNKTNPFAEMLTCLVAFVIKKPLLTAIFSICHY